MQQNATVQFVQTTPEDLYKEVKKIINDLEVRLTNQFQPKQPDELLTRQQTADLLKIDLSTLWLWTKKGRLKSYGIGNRVYYKRSEIDQAIVEL